MRFVFSCFCLALLFTSCAKKSSNNKKHTTSLDSVYQQEAMLADIPIPFYDERILLDDDYAGPEQHAIVLGYKSSLSSEEITNFYLAEMERLGWRQVKVFKGSEALLHFENPGRLCTVSIRSQSNKSKYTSIFVFTGIKEQFVI